MTQTTWRVGDPEPEPGPPSRRITLRGRTAAWYPCEGGWRTGTMAPYATIPWATLLEREGPLREIRLVGREWMFVDEIPAPQLSDSDAEAARAAGWVPLIEVLAVATTDLSDIFVSSRRTAADIDLPILSCEVHDWEVDVDDGTDLPRVIRYAEDHVRDTHAKEDR